MIEKTNDNIIPPFVQVELDTAKRNGHDMGHVFLSNFQFISFCKECHAPLYFTHEFDPYKRDVRRYVNGLTGSECRP